MRSDRMSFDTFLAFLLVTGALMAVTALLGSQLQDAQRRIGHLERVCGSK